jgi:A/G-specific adenine glycosylase
MASRARFQPPHEEVAQGGSSARFAPSDLAPQAQEGVLEGALSHAGEAARKLLFGEGVQRRGRARLRSGPRRPADRTLHNAQARHRTLAEIEVQAVQDQGRLVLYERRHGPRDPQLQGPSGVTRLDQLDGLGAARQRLADNLTPARANIARVWPKPTFETLQRRDETASGVARRSGRGRRPARGQNGGGLRRGRKPAGHDASIEQPVAHVPNRSDPQVLLDAPGLRTRLLAWYDANARKLPWRTPPADRRRGVRPDPYRVWLSEVMLQQTTVAHATPYFLAFIRRWPTVGDLAAADDAEVMAAWAGLGYYARARNLIACARYVAGELGGVFPDSSARLGGLPGVGPYTAAAIAAIAFDEPVLVVDANVERVMARLFAVETPLPGAKPELRRLASDLVERKRPGDWAQALMDLGARICTPAAPACERCPIAGACRGLALGLTTRLPARAPKHERPLRYGAAFVLTCAQKIALVRRPPRGLLGGMLALPTTDWRSAPLTAAEAVAEAPVAAAWRRAGQVRHVFTHFALELEVYQAEGPWPGAIWTEAAEIASMPSLFLKAARLALDPQPSRRR